MTTTLQFARTPLPKNLRQHLDEIEREILLDALEAFQWNRTMVAKAMGMSLRQIRYSIDRLRIKRPSEGDQNSHPM